MREGAHRAGSRPWLAGVEGGRYAPLDPAQVETIDLSARQLLSEVGLSDAPPIAADLVTARGGALTDDGRLTFPDPLIAAALDGLSRSVTLHGQVP
ncbi:MAG: methyltransferase, partial [Xanthomonadales bacterium]|nr:methyltransferase [Xanthomonadales bacterium]